MFDKIILVIIILGLIGNGLLIWKIDYDRKTKVHYYQQEPVMKCFEHYEENMIKCIYQCKEIIVE